MPLGSGDGFTNIGTLHLIVAEIGVVLAVIAYFTNRTSSRLFLAFSGSYGLLAFAVICGSCYIAGSLAAKQLSNSGLLDLARLYQTKPGFGCDQDP